ncbi:MAG: MFS transporter [Acetobacteraceae bacterium]|nr:MFS transporter [Acetobacteraceae bacterium]
MQNLDGTVIATALPTMARAFGSDPIRMNVALTSYLLSLTVFIPASGWVADRYGARVVFRAAIGVFTAGSVLCGLANGLLFLVLARIVQGIGGAMMVPVGRLVLLRTVAKQDLVAAMAWLTMPALIGPVVGPPLGGLIVTYASWRWIFLINVPVGMLGALLVTLFVPDAREPDPGRFDARGLVLSAVALSGLVFGLDTAGRGLVGPATTAALIGCGLLAALLFWRHARRHSHPILDFGLMRVPSFAISVWAGTLFRVGIQAIPFLLPLMLQIGFGVSPAASGAITFASSAGALVMKPVAPAILRSFGFRRVLVWNAVLSAAALATYAFFRPSWPVALIYATLLGGGFLRSLQFTAYNTIAYADIERDRMSAATGFYATIQQLSQAIGVPLGAAALEGSMWARRHTAPMLDDFSSAFLVVAVVSLLAAPVSLRLAPDAGRALTGRPGAAPS